MTDHYAEALERGKRVGALIDSINRPTVYADPIAKAVDDYMLMERKARAWDALRRRAEDWVAIEITLAEMDELVHPAHI